MPDKDREIVVKIRCGEKTCDGCRQRVPEYADEMGQRHVYQGIACQMFGVYLGLENEAGKVLNRCPACLAAELNTPSGSPAPQGAGKRNSVAGHPKKA